MFPQLKPYVSYACEGVSSPPFTAQLLFHSVYTPKVVADFQVCDESKLYFFAHALQNVNEKM